MTACMGGFCARREACVYYHAQDRARPIERLCEPGQRDAFERETYADRVNRIRAEALALLAEGTAGPMHLEWARQFLRQNPRPMPALEPDEQEWEL